MDHDYKLAVIGVGYVGLPLAVEFGKKYQTLGFDVNEDRIKELQAGIDKTLEVATSSLHLATELTFTANASDLMGCDCFIVTVPTPVDSASRPDLLALKSATEIVAANLRFGAVVIYESTVYPGCTEEICVPILEKLSGLKLNEGFYVGYSPERINPGDKVNTLPTIKKITSGSNDRAAKFVDELYGTIISAGTHMASSIKVAEAAKVIENTQRDLNIAVINEFAKIFNLVGIDTQEVLEAAGTKWNFIPFKPGLVGGHCISVDPHYLTYKARELGYHPEVILAGRRINDGMAQYTANQLIKAISRRKIHIAEAKILVLGFTFKGDCPDVRNTKIIDMIKELESFDTQVDVYDSWANPEEVYREYGLKLCKNLGLGLYDAIVLAVDHSEFKKWGEAKIRALGKTRHVLYDVKHVLPVGSSDLRL